MELTTNKKTQTFTLIVFLLGIFMGAIDNGVVSPARTIIQNSFSIPDNIGVWVVTIYTLSYAVSMPIVSKLSDKFGMKKVYILSIITFAFGSLLCGISNFYGGFSLLLTARVIQAIGGGGIMPIANAFIATSFPKEKRGSALGIIGAVHGIATILGPTLGSTILSFSGSKLWGWLFFINIPITFIILIMSRKVHEKPLESEYKKMDLKGSIALSMVILSLMYSLTNLNFFSIAESIKSNSVWPYLLIFLITVPLFIIIEKRAEDPVLNLNYFKNKEISKVLSASFLVGCGLMGVVFVPQFGENVLKLKSGTGGYLVTLMALFSGISAPLGGKLIDKYSAKLVMMFGFSSSAIGTLILAFITTSHPSIISLIIGLAFVGFGMGFTLGTPLNYLMLTYVPKKEATSALSTLSLVRSIGIAISPNIMVNFIASAAKNIPDKIKEVLPPFTVPNMGKMPALSAGSFDKVQQGLADKFKSADVTTVVDLTKDFMSSIINKIAPNINPAFKNSYLNQIESKRLLIENTFQSTLNQGFKNMFIAAFIIAVLGLLITLTLRGKNEGALKN